jgi:two-component system phosphate regulon response regulator PhoB
VLVFGEDADIRMLLLFNLRVAGMAATAMPVARARSGAPPSDVAVVDLALGEPGIDTLRALRSSQPDVAIMALAGSASGDEPPRVFASGADDYMPLPFAVSELVAHVRALARFARERRLTRVLASPTSSRSAHGLFSWGGLVLDAGARRVYVDGAEVPSGAFETSLLRLLFETPSRIFTRGQIVKAIWGGDGSNRGAIDAQVRHLRAKLGRYAGAIQVFEGVGYRLGVPASAPRPAATQSSTSRSR